MYKMMIPNDCSSNCFDCVLYSFLKHFNYDYELYNVKFFYTDYYDESCQCIHRKTSTFDMLNELFGIDIIFHKDISDLKYIAEALLNNGPIGIYIDPFYCEWSPFFKTAHYTHVLLIVGIDRQEHKFICLDVYYPKAGYTKVDIDELTAKSEEYFTFHMNDAPSISTEMIISLLSKTVNQFVNNLTEKKEQFFNYLTEDARESLPSSKIETSALLINLMWIAEDKKHFPIVFRRLENMLQQSIFPQVYELAAVAERNFTQLRLMLIKYAITNRMSEANIKNIIGRIYDIDTVMIEYVDKIIRTNFRECI